MSFKIRTATLPRQITPELLTLVDSLHTAYEKRANCGCTLQIGTEDETFHHAPSQVIHLGLNVVQAYAGRHNRLDVKAAVMMSYVLGHEYGHAVLERRGMDDRSIMALYFMGAVTLQGQKAITRDTHRLLNVPISAEKVNYLSGQPDAIRNNYRSYLRLLPNKLREPNLTNLSVGEFLAEMNAAVLLQDLKLKWEHPLRSKMVSAVQQVDWYRDVVPQYGQPMQDLVSFLRWNGGLQKKPAALEEFLGLFTPQDIQNLLPAEPIEEEPLQTDGEILVEFH
jgi:hypothetical protein